MSFCAKCGVRADSDDVYCRNCGYKHRQAVTEGADPVTVPWAQPESTLTAAVPGRVQGREADGPVGTSDEILKRVRQGIGIHTSTVREKTLVDIVLTGSPAFGAGLEKGDVIVSVGERAVGNIGEFVEAMGVVNLSQPFSLTVLRDGSKHVVSVDPRYQPPRVADSTTRTSTVAMSTGPRRGMHKSRTVSAVGYLITGVFLIVIGVYFGNYAVQNFSCNAMSALGVKPPLSCVWYESTYALRHWFIGFGVLSVAGGVVSLALPLTKAMR